MTTESRARRPTYVLPDPGGEYSLALMDRLFVQHGLRPLCVYADAHRRAQAERTNPVLRGHLVEAAFVGQEPAALADALRARYDVRGVIPHQEEHVTFAGALCDALGVPWNSAATLAPFRDKALLKTVLAASDVRVPAHRMLDASTDLDDPTLPGRFVIKPNDGVGNRAVGVFTRGDIDGVRRHLASHPTERWILEEHIDGPEFSVNGQVRSDGTVVVYGLMEYERTVVGDCPTVYSSEWVCDGSHPQREAITSYADAVLRASGLRRSPFHLEVKVDERGPCVIDLAARFGGAGLVPVIARSSPGAIDPFTLAAHDYVGSTALDGTPVEWRVHDDSCAMFVYGLVHEPCTVHHLSGCEEIEAHPAFVRWVAKPYLGQRLERTQALYSTPYIVDLRAPQTAAERRELVAHVQGTIRWNLEPARGRQVALAARHRARLARDQLLGAAAAVRHRIGAR